MAKNMMVVVGWSLDFSLQYRIHKILISKVFEQEISIKHKTTPRDVCTLGVCQWKFENTLGNNKVSLVNFN